MTTTVFEGWRMGLTPAGCPHCQWNYLLPAGTPLSLCPHCFQTNLVALETPPDLRTPELLSPFTVLEATVTAQIAAFAKAIPFTPPDLTVANLQQRLCRVYLPTWLVDANVQAQLEVEVGFDYEIVTHRDQFQDNQWVSQQVKETKVRWEPRLGLLQRRYQNVVVPALDEEAQLSQQLGSFPLNQSQTYQPQALNQAWVRLPGREPQSAWPYAEPSFQAAAAEECRQAAQAQHARNLRWTAHYDNLHWTQLLRPVYITYYLDDQKKPQPILIHGQSGQLSGRKIASLKRGKRWALVIGFITGLLLLFSLILTLLGLAAPPLLIVGFVFSILSAVGMALGVLIPLVIPWHFNRQQPQKV